MARKPFTPKPFGPGADVEIAGISGVVWSEGPQASSLWIARDGDTSRMVAVKKATKAKAARVIVEGDGSGSIRAAERLREGAFISEREARAAYGTAFTFRDLHADLACPKASGAEIVPLPEISRGWAARILVLDGAHGHALAALGLGNVCPCVYQDAADAAA